MRPNFMSSPGVWLRTPRTSQTEAEYATAIHHADQLEHAANMERYARPWDRLIWIGFVIFLACLFVALLP